MSTATLTLKFKDGDKSYYTTKVYDKPSVFVEELIDALTTPNCWISKMPMDKDFQIAAGKLVWTRRFEQAEVLAPHEARRPWTTAQRLLGNPYELEKKEKEVLPPPRRIPRT